MLRSKTKQLSDTLVDKITSDNPLTASQEHTLLALAAAVLPPSTEYGVPGADDADIAADTLATAKRHHAAVASALALLEAVAQAKHGTGFAELDATQRAALAAGAGKPGFLDDLDGDCDPAGATALRALLSLVVQCYYRDDRVMRSLDMEPRAPFPQGFEVEQGDWSLLEPVKQRGRIYRDAG